MHDLYKTRHLDCGFVLVSTKIDDGFGAIRPAIERDTGSVLDLSALRDEFTDEQFNASRFDAHPSALVHHRIAERLAAWLVARGALGDSSRVGSVAGGRAATIRWRARLPATGLLEGVDQVR